MKLKDGYTLKKVMGSYMIISTKASDENQMQTLNETGAFLWNLLENDTTVDQMCSSMLEEYDIDSATAKRDIEAFVEKLDKSDLLEK